jgi:hypothetical protein
MHVIDSTYTIAIPQIDDRVWITEVHTFDNDATREYVYFAVPSLDFQAIADNRGAWLEDYYNPEPD